MIKAIKNWAFHNLPCNWQNAYTGEIFFTLAGAVVTAIRDYRHFPKCRTKEIFNIVRLKEEE